jgi:hypothetical protein
MGDHDRVGDCRPRKRVREARLRSLLEHFGLVKVPLEPAKVRYLLAEILLLLLVMVASIADCDDYGPVCGLRRRAADFLALGYLTIFYFVA